MQSYNAAYSVSILGVTTLAAGPCLWGPKLWIVTCNL